MERAIGEVFQHEGKWYRVEKGEGCAQCSSVSENPCGKFKDSSFGECVGSYRTDSTPVIFVLVPPPNSTDLRFTLVEGSGCSECVLLPVDWPQGVDCLRSVLGLPNCGDKIYKVEKT